VSSATAPRRLCDLAEQAGLEYHELRQHLVHEVDARVRGRRAEVTGRDRQLFAGDPGYVGDVPLTQSASHRRSLTQSAAHRRSK
jgi:hypothetical protein